MANDSGEGKGINLFFVTLAGSASIAAVLSLYHCITVGCYRYRRPPSAAHLSTPEGTGEAPSSLQHSTVQLIPAYTYSKEVVGMVVGDEKTCSVCLCEFKEGEEMRVLPECLHSFHAPCIDMWLYSHPNCPLCRADTTPSQSPQLVDPSHFLRLPNIGD